jgi:hypothetical protein
VHPVFETFQNDPLFRRLALKLKNHIAIGILFYMLAWASLTWGQFAQRGGIDGFVQDPSGAVLPGAKVQLINVTEKLSRETDTSQTGQYSFTELAAGQYQLTVTAAGFQSIQTDTITVNIGRSTRYDIKLKPGSTTQSVTVTGTSGELQTGQASLDTNISERQMEDLPLNGRNFTSIAALAPGVSTTPQLNINPGGTYSVGAMFASGGVSFTTGGVIEGFRDDGFYINGVNIDDNYVSSISYEPSAEALSTATVAVADFSATNGRDVSSLTLQTKGGGSQFHGEAYDFLENDALNAVNPFDKAESESILGTPAIKPTLRRNQYGGNLGGPIYIPKLLPSLKDRFFFFANYEEFAESDGSEPVYASVPSAAERTGNFSELLSGPSPLQLYNPFYTTYDASGASSRPPIPNNRLDLATKPDGSPVVDPGSGTLLSIYPMPNISNTPSYMPNYFTTEHLGFTDYHFDSRFDASITSKDHVFVTWSKSHGSNDNSGGISPSYLYLSNNVNNAILYTVNYAHLFTQNLANEFIFGYGDSWLTTNPQSAFNYLNSDSNVFNQTFQNTGSGITRGVLALDVYNYASPGFNEMWRDENDTLQFADNLSWTRGRHDITAGINYFRKGEYDWDFIRFVTYGEGTYGAGFPRQQFSSGGYNQNYAGGDGMADLVMGTPQVINQRYNFVGGDATAPEINIYAPYWGAYVNDKFQASQKLTISAGLRYDLSIPAYAANNLCCAIYSPTSDGGVLKIPGIAAGVPQHYLSAAKLNFAPRVSIAYNPRSTMVIRAGYGIFFDSGASEISKAIDLSTSAMPGFYAGDQLTNTIVGVPSDTPALTTSQVFPVPPNLAPGQYPVSTGPGEGYFGDGQLSQIIYYDQKSVSLPYYQRYILDLQQQLTSNDSFTLSYIGSQGRKGSNLVNDNLPPYKTGWPTQNAFNAARPNNSGRYSDIYVVRPNLNSHYNAGIVQFQHRFSHGIQFLSNYTFAKTVSDYPVENNVTGGDVILGDNSGFQYPNIFNRGETDFSHRHRFVYSGIWQPTYGASWSSWAKVPLTGWRLSAIGTLESGDKFTVVNMQTTAADYAGLDEMSILPGLNPNYGHSQRTFSQQFNVGDFSLPSNGTRGNSGLATIRGPGQNNLDLSVAKTFPIHERLHVEFRADAFNAFNHTQWNGTQTVYPYAAVGNYGNLPFGQVTGAREARITQLAFKVAF